MPPQRKGAAARVSEDTEDLTRHPLQAILLADSFATKFRPITLERPKVRAHPYENTRIKYMYLFIAFWNDWFGFVEGVAAVGECADDRLHIGVAGICWSWGGFCFLLRAF